MLPKLRVILAAIVATCAVVLAASAGLVGTRDPGKRVADVPDLSRAIMQHAIVEAPEWQHFELLAYSRRADELLRLRDLPVTPTRAVIEYAERAQAEAAASAPPPTPEVAVASVAPEPAETAAAPAAPLPVIEPLLENAETKTETPPIEVAAAPIETPAAAEPPPTEAPLVAATTAEPAPAPAAAGDNIQVANVPAGTNETAAAGAPTKPEAKPTRIKRAFAARPHKKKARVSRVRRVSPAAATGFPVEGNRTSALFGANSNARR